MSNSMSSPYQDIQLLHLLADRLERISADSIWAHRASGVRGSLLRMMEEAQKPDTIDPNTLSLVISVAMHILTQAAKQK